MLNLRVLAHLAFFGVGVGAACRVPVWKSPEEQQKENWGERKRQAEQLGGGRGRKLEAARGKVKEKKKSKRRKWMQKIL